MAGADQAVDERLVGGIGPEAERIQLLVSEIAGLRIADVRVESSRPHIKIRKGAAKGGKPRIVPLWWDAGTLADLARWKGERTAQGAKPDHLFVSCLQAKRRGTSLSRHTLRKRFRTAVHFSAQVPRSKSH